jgi:hypothetical protein
MSIETLNILNGLSHILGEYGHDGATNADGDPVKIGLRREEGNPIIDSRVIDGFGLKFYGDKMCLSYNIDGLPLKEVYGNTFESDIEQSMSEVESFLKKEFRKNTGTSLSLKQLGETEIDVEHLSRVRTLVRAKRHFKLGNIKSEAISQESDEKRVDKAIRDFLSLKTDKRAKNDKAKNDSFDPFNPSKMQTGQRKQ